MADRVGGKFLHGPIQWLKEQAEIPVMAVPAEEPDYGMSAAKFIQSLPTFSIWVKYRLPSRRRREADD